MTVEIQVYLWADGQDEYKNYESFRQNFIVFQYETIYVGIFLYSSF